MATTDPRRSSLRLYGECVMAHSLDPCAGPEQALVARACYEYDDDGTRYLRNCIHLACAEHASGIGDVTIDVTRIEFTRPNGEKGVIGE